MKPTASPLRRLIWNLLAALAGGLVLTAAALIVTHQSVARVPALAAEHPLALLWNVLLTALLTLIFGLLMKRLSRGFMLTAAVVMCLVIANYFKTLITSTPLELYELAQVFQLGPIVSLNAKSLSLSGYTAAGILLPLAWFAALRLLAKPVLDLNWRWSLGAAGGALAVFLLLFVVLAGPLIYSPLEAPLSDPLPQAAVNQRCYVPLGLWRSVLFREGPPELPDTQTERSPEEQMADAVAGVEDVSTEKTPNVIMILSESFFDVTTLPGVEFETDPLEEFHALQAESVSGKFYTHSLGYGTCGIELGLLTGVNDRLLSYGENLAYWPAERLAALPTVPELFQQAGYYTGYLHLYNDSIYNRRELFSQLGFADMYFSEDMAQVDPEAAQAGDYWGYMAEKISGAYYGDAYLTDLIIDLYEREQENGPVFLYAASMENHTPYNADKYPAYDYPFASGLSQEAADVLNAYTQGAAQSSKALRALTDYFAQVDEPTIIVFYGDHRPGLGLEDMGSVYTELGMLIGDLTTASAETLQTLYSTEYLIWSNDPSLLRHTPGAETDSSANYLGLETLKTAGIKLPNWWKLLDAASQAGQVYNWSFYVDPDGKAFLTLPQSVDSAIYDLTRYALHNVYREDEAEEDEEEPGEGNTLREWLWGYS